MNASSNNLDQIIYDIYTCIENNKGNSSLSNPNGPNTNKIYSKEIVKLYHVIYYLLQKYVEKMEKKQQSHDPKGVQEMTKQIVHL